MAEVTTPRNPPRRKYDTALREGSPRGGTPPDARARIQAIESAALAYCQTQPGHKRGSRKGQEVACPPCLRLAVHDRIPDPESPGPVEIPPTMGGSLREVLGVLIRAMETGEKVTAQQIAARTDPPLSGTASAGARIRDLRNQPYNYHIPAEYQHGQYVYWLDPKAAP